MGSQESRLLYQARQQDRVSSYALVLAVIIYLPIQELSQLLLEQPPYKGQPFRLGVYLQRQQSLPSKHFSISFGCFAGTWYD